MHYTNEIQQAKEFIQKRNLAKSTMDQPLGYEEVIETADRAKSTRLKLIGETIAKF
jgi:hypothetical protein